eukprot:494001-Prorocentrum_minimum.AAC.1
MNISNILELSRCDSCHPATVHTSASTPFVALAMESEPYGTLVRWRAIHKPLCYVREVKPDKRCDHGGIKNTHLFLAAPPVKNVPSTTMPMVPVVVAAPQIVAVCTLVACVHVGNGFLACVYGGVICEADQTRSVRRQKVSEEDSTEWV